MNKELAKMKKLQNDENTIAYVHGDIVILYRRVTVDENRTALLEIKLHPDNGQTISKRELTSDEMSLDEFERIRAVLFNSTKEEFNSESAQTYKNVSYEQLANSASLALSSVEDEYIAKLEKLDRSCAEAINPLAETTENAERIMDLLLSEKQKRWLKMSILEELSDREIARREPCAHTTVSRALRTIRKKFEKYRNLFK